MNRNRNRIAAKIYRDKITLERDMMQDMKRYFGQCKASVKSGRAIPPVKPYLEKHNKRCVGKLFKIPKKKKNNIDKKILQESALKNNKKLVNTHAMMIDEKTKELVRGSTRLAQETLKDANGITSTAALNKTTAEIFNNYNQNRIAGIAMTETTTMYETAKRKIYDDIKPVVINAIDNEDIDTLEEIDDFFESDTIDAAIDSVNRGEDASDIIATVVAGTHTWVSMGDDKVRETHQEADGQVKPIDEPFDVGDYQLMFPGDDSLGAGAEEICNCRCSEVF